MVVEVFEAVDLAGADSGEAGVDSGEADLAEVIEVEEDQAGDLLDEQELQE